MARHRYLIAYDIADPKRLRRVITLMEGVGERLQYSVFLCDLSGMERVVWERDIRAAVKLSEDSVVVLDLGPVELSVPVATLGVPRRFPSRGATIV